MTQQPKPSDAPPAARPSWRQVFEPRDRLDRSAKSWTAAIICNGELHQLRWDGRMLSTPNHELPKEARTRLALVRSHDRNCIAELFAWKATGEVSCPDCYAAIRPQDLPRHQRASFRCYSLERMATDGWHRAADLDVPPPLVRNWPPEHARYWYRFYKARDGREHLSSSRVAYLRSPRDDVSVQDIVAAAKIHRSTSGGTWAVSLRRALTSRDVSQRALTRR